MTARPLPVLALCLAAGLVGPTEVEACACCDGGSKRVIEGWSRSGRSALVHFETVGCDARNALEIWTVGNDAPRGCFDLYGDGNKRVACDSLAQGHEAFSGPPPWPPARTGRRSFYPVPPERAKGDTVRATYVPLSCRTPPCARRDPAGDDYEQPIRLVVEVRTRSGWSPVFTRRLFVGATEYDDDGRYVEDRPLPDEPISVQLWPTPKHDRALLRVSGHNTAPGMGHFPTDLFWVELPADMDHTAWEPATNTSEAAHYAIARHEERIPWWHRRFYSAKEAKRAARRHNGAGLRHHRAGRFERAARDFVRALALNPGHVVARYNLACALARTGAPDRAMALLEEIAGAGCARCEERMKRAEEDPDLDALRTRPDFARLRTLRSPRR